VASERRLISLSVDTNILYSSVQAGDARHADAVAFMEGLRSRGDVVISEFALMELYQLLRNPAVVRRVLSPEAAVAVCAEFRSHPRWQVVGLPGESREFHDALWPRLAIPGFARRRTYDWRIALSLLRQSVDEFATVNLRDFEGFGFRRLWNPLAS
jgi:predicted nucleic acid-binding protein